MSAARFILTNTGASVSAGVRVRQLDVRDDQLVYLLALVADDMLAKRRRREPAGLVALEMQAALTAMVTS